MFLGLNVTVSEDRDTVFQKVVSLKGIRQVKVFMAQSCLTLQTPGLQPARLLRPGDSPGRNTGVGCHFLLRWLGRGGGGLSSRPREDSGNLSPFCIAGRFFTIRVRKEAHLFKVKCYKSQERERQFVSEGRINKTP